MASTSYISASANRFYGAADASTESLVAFGSGRLVALWDASDVNGIGIYGTLAGHAAPVTCVRFMQDRIVSADEKGGARIWRRHGETWKCTSVNQLHTSSISTLGHYERCLVSGSSDGSVKVWTMILGDEGDHLEERQSIDLRGRLPMALALSRLPLSESFILAVGGTYRDIDIWTSSDGKFTRAVSLSGHEDWVRSLAFLASSNTLVLASGSQDNTVRLWNVELSARPEVAPAEPALAHTGLLTDEVLASFEASFKDAVETEDGARHLSLKRHRIATKSVGEELQHHEITFDALLIGHEAGITSLAWSSMDSLAPLTLLSTSTDSSMILWQQTSLAPAVLWTGRHRFGDVGGQRLGGFVGGMWAGHGTEVLAWGWTGGWRRWRCMSAEDTWMEVGAITGHNGPVHGVAWSPGGEYLLSTSLDQTARVHGMAGGAWHELARPQVHGYDVLRGAFVGPLRFVSIGDEKVARVFDAPRGFVDLVRNVSDAVVGDPSSRPAGASVPPLGLSNKALADGDNDVPILSVPTDRAPFEGELAAITLWPEVEKVFGHGYELIALAVSHSHRLLATACKATTVEHAVVRLYDTTTWRAHGPPLAGHALTVTRITFSPDDRYLLSVSRDRTWRLFEVANDGYRPIAADKSHARIIWDCAWAHEGDVFATASRDKTTCLWGIPKSEVPAKWSPLVSLKMEDAATAVAFLPADANGRRLLAVGLESGEIVIHANSTAAPLEWEVLLKLNHLAHVDHVYALEWRPAQDQTQPEPELASCSDDGTVRITKIPTM